MFACGASARAAKAADAPIADIANHTEKMQFAAMKASVVRAGIAPLFLLLAHASAQASQPFSQVGEAYEITKSYETSQESSDGSKGSSRGTDAFLERVIGRRDGGLELEYDLPLDATAAERARNWQLPVRVLRIDGGRMKLLNAEQLEERLEGWLRAAKWDRSMCGRWIFTWNAFRIECDPQSIIAALEEIDLQSQDLRDGAPYLDTRAIEPGGLVRKGDGSTAPAFSAVTRVDPSKVHLERAEGDVATGEIMQKPVSLEAALLQRSKEQVSGSILVAWETDEAGVARKRTKRTTMEIKRPDGIVENRTATQVVERRRVSATLRDGS